MKLLDTHQHLVYPDAVGYGWVDDVPVLANKSFTLDHYKTLTHGADVIGSLFMETGVDDADYQAETRFVAELMQQKDSGILGLIASCRPEDEDGFDAWLEECADLDVVGYRRILHVMDDALSTSDTFRRNVAKIGAQGKTFDLCILPRQMRNGGQLIAACRDTQFILNHCGVPDIAGGAFDVWRKEMTTIAAHENVVCKLSGILAYCAEGSANLAAIRPYVDHVFDVFGPKRMVWGSDWPVVDLAHGLPDWIAVTRGILQGLSANEAGDIGYATAQRTYRI